ncbi:geranylgeranyl pyrophosphate synthetase [Trichoderma arundinaceum]|uniref:Geranylgeranyl pyrophosphate synthetase n=1 Tax=Trichoderma arundinaceum TaxID=490622 RepID=A0A395NKL3_TRIAR|nr:geranylgeranyl pyrophosphate synthetase [Trichoderma arundinaceum]
MSADCPLQDTNPSGRTKTNFAPFDKGRRGRGGFRGVDRRNPLVQTKESPPPPLGDLIEAISQKSLDNSEGEDVYFGITESKLIASYNWADQKAPKIIIPGCPPLWKPLEHPQQLQGDSGVYYRDHNSAFFPKHPLEPAIVSVMRMHPNPLEIDIVGCNSTFGHLLRFVRGIECTFRMLVEVVGETVHLVRRENSPKEQLLGVKGFGHTFPDAYTIWAPDVQPSKSHHRILTYRFGGLSLLIRQSCDGYIEEKETKVLPATAPSKDQEDGIVGHFESLSINSSSVRLTDATPLEVVDGGQLTPQSTIFDLKTRSIRSIDQDTLGNELPRLWAMQIPKFILAHHKHGLFCNIEVSDIQEEVQNWEKSHQPDLNRLSALLCRIIATALEKKDTLLEIVRVQGGPLEIRQRLPDAGVAFSEQVKEQWLKWLDGGGEAHNDSDSESGSESGDFTGCNEECGYCGKCS